MEIWKSGKLEIWKYTSENTSPRNRADSRSTFCFHFLVVTYVDAKISFPKFEDFQDSKRCGGLLISLTYESYLRVVLGFLETWKYGNLEIRKYTGPGNYYKSTRSSFLPCGVLLLHMYRGAHLHFGRTSQPSLRLSRFPSFHLPPIAFSHHGRRHATRSASSGALRNAIARPHDSHDVRTTRFSTAPALHQHHVASLLLQP